MILLVVVFLGGCIGDPGPTEEVTETGALPGEGPEAPDRAEPASVDLQDSYSGRILYRAPVPVLPEAEWEGDPPGFCFETPPDSTRLVASLTWSPPQDIVLEMFGPNGSGQRSWDPDAPWTGFLNVTPPIELVFDEPAAGAWYTYVGPPAAGGMIDWTLELTWTVARADATVQETVYEGEPCGL